MTEPALRESYLRWLRGASPALVVPLVLTALVQMMASSEWWSSGPAPSGAVRYIFLSVAVVSIVVGRNVRDQELQARPLDVVACRSLSWKLLVYALAPAVLGAVLAVMTRQVYDYFMTLFVTLVGLWVLFPRYVEWATWASAPETETA